MASPFELFRRNQWLVVALFGLSIFAFVLLDPLTSGGGGGRLFPIVLGVLLGGVAFWLLSGQKGKAAVAWAAAGAVAGGLFVGLGSDFFGDRTVIATSAGDLSSEDIEELDARRQTAVGFFGRLGRALAEKNPDDPDIEFTRPPITDYAGLIQTRFGSYPNVLGADASRTEDLLFGYLLNREADEVGLEISDEQINRLINTHYGVAPDAATVRKIRSDFGVGETSLFDAIRAELRARGMFTLLLPRTVPLPSDDWTLYRELNQSADLSLVALPVEDFLDEAPEPTDAEVSALFERYRDAPADPLTGLGFRRPSQIELSYLKADRAAAAESVPAPTDEEVRAYYEENRELFRNPAYDDYLTERQMGSAAPPAGDAEPAPADGDPGPAPTLPSPALPTLDADPESGEQPPADEPPPAAETPAEAPTEELPAPDAEADAGEMPAADEDGETEPDAPAEEPDAEGSLPRPIVPDEPGGEEQAAAGFVGVGYAAVQDDPEGDDPGGDDPPRRPVTAPKPVAGASSDAAAKTDSEESAPDAPADAAPPVPAAGKPMDAAAAPGDGNAPPAADEPAVGEVAPPAPEREPPPEFYPLDAERTESIRQQLKNARVEEETDRRINAALEFMLALGSDVWAELPDPNDPDVTLSEAEIESFRQEARKRIAAEMRGYAEEHGLTYGETDYVGVEDIRDEDADPVLLAESGSGRADPFAPRELAVASLFENFTGPLYQIVRTGARPETGDRFAVWKTGQRYSAPQELAEPGVREAVVAAFKRQKAAELARARAQELAAAASKEGVTLADAVAGRTATGPAGEDDADALEVQPTGPFTRMRLTRPSGRWRRSSRPSPSPAACRASGRSAKSSSTRRSARSPKGKPPPRPTATARPTMFSNSTPARPTARTWRSSTRTSSATPRPPRVCTTASTTRRRSPPSGRSSTGCSRSTMWTAWTGPTRSGERDGAGGLIGSRRRGRFGPARPATVAAPEFPPHMPAVADPPPATAPAVDPVPAVPSAGAGVGAMIEARGLSKFYGPFAAVRDVTFAVPRGQVCAFLGPNGAGKSTTMRMLTGFLAPSAGGATIAGHDVAADRLDAAAALGYLPENGPLYQEMSPSAFLRYVGSARGMGRSAVRDRCGYVRDACSLGPVWGKPIAKLSRGYRQRVGMAQALLHDPEVLILDEPTGGLDPNQVAGVRDLIAGLRDANKTLLISTHILREVRAVCDRVLLIAAGKLVFDGPAAELAGSEEEMEAKFRELTAKRS